MNNKSYDRITERIVSLLTQGTVPWHKPWRVKTGLPRNLVSQKPYRGINVFLLMAMNYESPHWLTLRQANLLGGQIMMSFDTVTPVLSQMEVFPKVRIRTVGTI